MQPDCYGNYVCCGTVTEIYGIYCGLSCCARKFNVQIIFNKEIEIYSNGVLDLCKRENVLRLDLNK